MRSNSTRSVAGAILGLAILVAASGCAPSSPVAAPSEDEEAFPPVTIRWGTEFAEGTPLIDGANQLADLVSERTDGRVTIEVFPAGQLGSAPEMDEGLVEGSIDMRMGSFPADRMPALEIINAPGLYDTTEQAVAMWRSDVAQDLVWTPLHEQLDIVHIDSWLLGVHQFTSNVPFTDPETIKGVKVRVPPVQTFVDIIDAYGGVPTPIAFNEVYLALQTGVVDAQSNALVNIYGAKVQEVQKYYIPANVVTIAPPLLIRQDALDQMSDDDQKVLFDTAREVGDEVFAAATAENESLEKQVEQDLEVLEPDIDAFAEKIETVFLPKYESIYGAGVWEALHEEALKH
jgi:tripartite ATP-independent transporter DctP family solute receptor